MSVFSRRHLLALATAAGSAIGLSSCKRREQTDAHSASDVPSSGVFTHGIASGDPTSSSIILWTRLTLDPASMARGQTGVMCYVSEGDEFEPLRTELVAAQTNAASDWTIKVDKTGLKPGTHYYYKFQAGEMTSPVGHFKTLPEGAIDQARFAIVSCANAQAGYFNVYDHIARDPSFDAVLHLGDYFYEYGQDGWGGAMQDKSRLHQPAHELLSLEDYRTRHAQYRTDGALQKMSTAHPMICLWDDHEVANDSFVGGAQNHQDDEGDWTARRDAAMRAYYEWMPVREPDVTRARHELFRAYSYGDLLTLVTLETRLMARAEPIDIDVYTREFSNGEDVAAFKADVLNKPGRHMMGDVQMDFVVDALSKSKAAGQPWRLVANQVIMGRLATPDLTPHVQEEQVLALEADWPGVRDFVKYSAHGLPVYPDSWDGYPWARDQFYDRLNAAGVNDIIVVTGDAHEYWANDLTDASGAAMGVELGTTSVTSPTLKSYFGDATADYSLLMTQENKDVRYYNALHHGYLDLTLSQNRGAAKFVSVDTVLSRDYVASQTAAFTLTRNEKGVRLTKPKGLSLMQRALFSGLG